MATATPDMNCVYCDSHILDAPADHAYLMHRDCAAKFDHEYGAILDAPALPACCHCHYPITDWSDMHSMPNGLYHADCVPEWLAVELAPYAPDTDWTGIAWDKLRILMNAIKSLVFTR